MKSSLLRRTELPFIFCLQWGSFPGSFPHTPISLFYVFILLPGREETGNGISPYVSGPPEELLHTWQERSTPDRDAGPTRTQRHSYHPGHLYTDYRPGGGEDGEPGHEPHPGLGWRG